MPKTRWMPRVKPGRSPYNRRVKMTDFHTTDQRLLAEIRDVLIAILDEQNATGIAVAVQRLERRLAAQQAAVEQLTAALAAMRDDGDENDG